MEVHANSPPGERRLAEELMSAMGRTLTSELGGKLPFRVLRERHWGRVMFVSALVAAALQFSSNPGVGSANLSISSDEMAVYESVLSSWLGKGHGRQLVDERLSAAPSKTDPELKECTRGLDLSATTQDSRKSLAGARFKRGGIELVDGSKWSPADPMQGIADGKSVESALKEAFSKSLISFSQIAFSRDGNDALVSWGMVCGGTCGSGSTMRLHKAEAGWVVLSRCKEWES